MRTTSTLTRATIRARLAVVAGELDRVARVTGWSPGHELTVARLVDDITATTGDVAADWPSWAQARLDRTQDRTAAPAGSRQTGVVSDPTLAAVASVCDQHVVDVLVHVDEARSHLRAAARMMATVVRTANAAELTRQLTELRCHGGKGIEGAEVWGDATCRQLAAKVGMCSAHYMGMRRWRAAQQTTLPKVDCPVCDGTGRVESVLHPGKFSRCEACAGTGKVAPS